MLRPRSNALPLLLLACALRLAACAPAGDLSSAHMPFDGLLAEDALAGARAALRSGASKAPLVLPLEVTVALIGLDGDGALGARVDAMRLGQLLSTALPSHRPAALDATGGGAAPLAAAYELRYRVLHLRGGAASALAAALKAELRPTGLEGSARDGSANGSFVTRTRAYEVEATRVEPFFDAAYAQFFSEERRAAERGAAAVAVAPHPCVLFVVSPDKAAVDPSPSLADASAEAADATAWGALGYSEAAVRARDGRLAYRYRYAGGAHSAAWLARGRYAVVDLSAGAARAGRLGGAAALRPPSVAATLLPYAAAAESLRAEAAASAPADLAGDPHAQPASARAAAALAFRFDAQLRSELAALATSAVRHLFAPDVRAKALDGAQRVLVPLIGLADHSETPLFAANTVEPEAETENKTEAEDEHAAGPGLDVRAVRREAARLLSPGQELAVAASAHALHAHPKLALAVRAAMRAHAPPGALLRAAEARAERAARNGTSSSSLAVAARATLDSAALLAALRASGDMLAGGGVLGLEDSRLEATFFNPHAPLVLPPDGANGGINGADPATSSSASPPPPGAQASGRAAAAAAARGKARSHGTRVVPAYLLSLRDAPPGLLLDGDALHAGGRGGLLLLTTREASALAPFYSGANPVGMAAASPTRAAIAGLAAALGGMTPPYARASSRDGGMISEEWLWGSGAQPFGPFGNSTALSQLLVDGAARAAVARTAHAALGHARAALIALDAFAARYLPPPPHGDAPAATLTALEAAAKVSKTPRGGDAVGALPSDVAARLAAELRGLERAFVRAAALSYDGPLGAAATSAEAALVAAYTLRQYAAEQLDAASSQLRCCRLTAAPATGAPLGAAASAALAGVVAFAAGFAAAGRGTGQQRRAPARASFGGAYGGAYGGFSRV